ncbi:MAG TPA: FxSxx-COOH system tetratricopeptide repeat protein [Streptosporangiaceae bacterium]|nr:FxSxx-COOH system tetratricopeptide repeat protein [Streptosporangiaceae bacterium]
MEPDGGAADRPAPRVAAFCSAEEHIGQTTTLVNVALVLAGGGRRVLIVDTRGGLLGAEQYLRPSAPSGGDTADRGEGRDEGRREAGTVDLITVDGDSPIEGLSRLAPSARPGPAEEAGAFDGYDYVLIDAPMVQTDAGRAALAGLADLVVACFTLNSWSIEGTADVARAVWERARAAGREWVTVVAVGLKVDTRMQDQLRSARAIVRTAFQGIADDGLRYLEIPYNAAYALIESPAARPLAETAASLGPYFGELAKELLEERSTRIKRATVVYTPRHRRWAEWFTAQLNSCEVEASALPFGRFKGESPGLGSALLVIAPTEIDRQAVDELGRLSHPNIRLVLVDDLTPAAELAHHEQLDLRRMTEPTAVARLRRSLHLSPAEGPPAGSVRFPRLPSDTNLAPRDPGFVGRDREIAGIDEALRSADGGVCVLTGESGIGKSALANEFAHRFGGDYDLVWWLSAASKETWQDASGQGRPTAGQEERVARSKSVQDGLLALADRLDVPGAGDRIAAVLERLAAPDSGPWLLIFDDAPGDGTLDGLLPETDEHRHIVVTSRESGAWPAARSVSVPPFSPADGLAVLSARVPGILADQAQIIGETVGYLPLTVGLAAAWLSINAELERAENRMPEEAVRNSVKQFGDEFRRAQHQIAADPAGSALPRAMVEVSLRLLYKDPGVEVWHQESVGSEGPVWLLETCAILSAGGLTVDVLKSPAMQQALAYADAPEPRDDPRRTGTAPVDSPAGVAPRFRSLSDGLVIDVALWSLARHGLIEVDLGDHASPIRMHPMLRGLIVRRMGARLDARITVLREALSRYAEPIDGGRAGADAAIVGYAPVLRPWEDDRPEVRQWLLRELSSLIRGYNKISLQRALELGRAAERAWADDARSAEYLRLLDLLAQTLRELGNYGEAGRLARQTLREQRRTLGIHHPRSLLSGDHYGSILWSTGDFRQAKTEVGRVITSIRRLLGPDHRATLQVQHNLAIAEVLAGNPRAGLELIQNAFNRLRAVGGEREEAAWDIAASLAFCHRALGQNRESFAILKSFLRRRGVLAPGSLPARMSLNAENGLAVAERRLNNPEGARERHERVHEGFIKELGEDVMATVSCRAGLAADLHSLGKHADAVDHANLCLRTLAGMLRADHPFVGACEVNLSSYQRAAGDLDGATASAQEAHARLMERLGPMHPWTLAATISLANLAAALGDYGRAADLEREVLHAFDELGLRSHPDYRLVTRNRADSLAGQGATSSHAHPYRRFDIDLELPAGI